MQIGELDRSILARVEIEQPEALEIRDQQKTWQVALGKSVEVVCGLGERAIEVRSRALVLDEQHAFPEGVDAAVLQLFIGARSRISFQESGMPRL